MKTSNIIIRCTSEEKAAWTAKANYEAGLSLSAYIRLCLGSQPKPRNHADGLIVPQNFEPSAKCLNPARCARLGPSCPACR